MAPVNTAPLMSLKIPSFWAVSINQFYDIEENTEEGKEFKILEIERYMQKDAGWANYYIRIFLKRENSENKYRLVIGKHESGDVKEFSSSDRNEVRETLENWMKTLNYTPEDNSLINSL